jgi:hypothetical protein
MSAMNHGEQQQIMSNYEWRVLYHEAAHAVMAVHHELCFQFVEVLGIDNGQTEPAANPIADPDHDWPEDDIAKWQLFYAAGAAAEMQLFGSYRKRGTREDRRLHDELESWREEGRDGGWEQDIQAAGRVLNIEYVKTVANELHRRGALNQPKRLTSEEVYELLGLVPSWLERRPRRLIERPDAGDAG